MVPTDQLTWTDTVSEIGALVDAIERKSQRHDTDTSRNGCGPLNLITNNTMNRNMTPTAQSRQVDMVAHSTPVCNGTDAVGAPGISPVRKQMAFQSALSAVSPVWMPPPAKQLQQQQPQRRCLFPQH